MKKELITNTLVPWTASGPGWSNRGCTAIVRVTADDGAVKDESVTIYSEHFDGPLHSAATILCAELERQFRAALMVVK